jgi:DNA polymerase-3 subunit gamma/tau
MRDAESTLDQLISFCGSEIAEADVLSMFGLAARGQLLALTDAVIAGDADKVLRELDELARNGKDLGRLLADLLNHFRNLLIFQVARGDTNLLEVSEAEAAALKNQAGQLGADAVTRVMEVLAEAEGRLRDSVSKKIALEVALLKAIHVRNAVSLDAVLGQLKALRGDAAATRPAAAPTVAAPPLESPTAPAAVSSDLSSVWSAVLEGVGRSSPFLRSYLLKGFPVSCEREALTIGFPPAAGQFLPLINNAKNENAVAAVLKQTGFANPRVKFVISDAAPPEITAPPPVAASPAPAAGRLEAAAPAPASTPPPAEPPPPRPAKPAMTKLDPATFKDDPLIKQAVEIFKGRIAQVVAPAGPAS